MARPGIAALLLLLLGPARSTWAQERFLHFGSRAASMGGAFTAVADDATAFHWNPAGYVFGPVMQLSFPWGESDMDRGALLESLGEVRPTEAGGVLHRDRAAGFSLGLTFMGVAGTFSRQTTSRREEDRLRSQGLETFDLAVSVLQSLPVDDLVIAANLHYLRGETHELVESVTAIEDRASSAIHDRILAAEGLTSSTGTLDLAALYEPNDWLRLGFMWRRLTEPRFRTPFGEEIALPRHARAGLAFRLPRRSLVSFDLDLSRQGSADERWRELSLGAEKRFLEERLSLRAGLRAETGSGRGARPAFSFGAGGRIRFLLAELAYVGAPDGRDEAVWFSVTLAP